VTRGGYAQMGEQEIRNREETVRISGLSLTYYRVMEDGTSSASTASFLSVAAHACSAAAVPAAASTLSSCDSGLHTEGGSDGKRRKPARRALTSRLSLRSGEAESEVRSLF